MGLEKCKGNHKLKKNLITCKLGNIEKVTEKLTIQRRQKLRKKEGWEKKKGEKEKQEQQQQQLKKPSK